MILQQRKLNIKKKYMKSKEEIKEWMSKQDWYPAFVLNCIMRSMEDGQEHFKENVQNRTNGYLGGHTILSAFRWDDTPEGHSFWSKVDDEYVAWYRSEAKFKDIDIFDTFSLADNTYTKISETEAIMKHFVRKFAITETVASKHKSKEDIAKYLYAQEWFPKYVTNIIIQSKCFEEIIAGNYKLESIVAAFNWGLTKEGWEFWEQIDSDFHKWYKEEVFINISKGEEFFFEDIKYKKITPNYAVPVDKIICLDKETPVSKK
jgi:hypothetical protein